MQSHIPSKARYVAVLLEVLFIIFYLSYWVTSEVLPSIRQYGAYICPNLLEKAQESIEIAEELMKRLKASYTKNDEILHFTATLIPKADYYDDILQSTEAMPVSIIAKDYGMTAIEFNRMLHDLGVQYKIGGTFNTHSRTFPNRSPIYHTLRSFPLL